MQLHVHHSLLAQHRVDDGINVGNVDLAVAVYVIIDAPQAWRYRINFAKQSVNDEIHIRDIDCPVLVEVGWMTYTHLTLAWYAIALSCCCGQYSDARF